MTCKRIAVLALLMTAAAAAYAQEGPSITQLQGIDAQAVSTVTIPAVPPIPTAKLPGPIKNFGVVVWKGSRGAKDGLVFRGGSPAGEAAFKFLGELGIKTVINFRTTVSNDQKLCAANGIECMEYAIVPSPFLTFSTNRTFLKSFKRAAADMEAGRKVFIHCQGGRHRTAALAEALYIRDTACGKPYDKADLSKAVAQSLKEFGFYNLPGKFLASYATEIQDWADNFEKNQWLCK